MKASEQRKIKLHCGVQRKNERLLSRTPRDKTLGFGF